MYSPETVVPGYERAVERMLLNHATGEDAGAFITEDGVPSGTHGANARFVAMAAYCYFDPASRVRGNRTLFDRIERALQFQIGLVHETGLIDLESTNWQSPSDTVFPVQLLCPIVELSVLYDDVDGAARTRELLTECVRLAASGIIDGGFHTPNHRWVRTISGGLLSGTWSSHLGHDPCAWVSMRRDTPTVDPKAMPGYPHSVYTASPP